MSIYGTWTIHFNEDRTVGTGPEEEIRSQGIEVSAVWSDGSPEDGALILGKLSDVPVNVSQWSFSEVTRTEAEALISSNFVYMPANPEKYTEEYTIEKALAYLD